jgi:type IV secretory pathway TrbF-like protein
VALTPPAELNQDQRHRNPLGVWVANLNWSKI